MDGVTTDFDVLIVGGGLVGASLACALADQTLRIGVIESRPFSADTQPSFDERAITLSHGTTRILSTMGIWEALSVDATPIHKIHVSDRGRCGITRLDREQENLPALGYVVPARVIGTVLMGSLLRRPALEMLCPAELTGISVNESHVTVNAVVEGVEKELTSKMVVAADGTRSVVRDQLSMPVQELDYETTALVCNVTTQLPHKNTAYERFTDDGPLAVLPRGNGRATFVWTIANERVEEVLRYSDDELIQVLQQQFGYRLGRLSEPGPRHQYPLKLVCAKESVYSRVALIGNAAHTLHPIAGQGFNLGIRDVATLAEVLVDAHRTGTDVGDPEVLQRYARWRERDHSRVTAFTDGLTRLFSNPLTCVKTVRNIGMLALELCPPAKSAFTRLTMGRSGKATRLARGISL